MIRVAISVEGDTEEEFVKEVLVKHLRTKGVEPTPILLGRGRGSFGGGNVSVDRLVPEMVLLFRSFDVVTSLVDFYGFKKKEQKTTNELQEELTLRISEKLGNRWQPQKVLPYVQKHEFEGLLFSDVDAFEIVIDVTKESIEKLRSIRKQFPTPEDINDDRATAPSKRIKKLIPRYIKKDHGPLIAAETGLDVIRAECPLFDEWVAHLESLGTPAGSE